MGIAVGTHGAVRTLTFDRPEKRNAFTADMYEQLVAALEEAAGDENVRVVLLEGAGGSFTAGNDLHDFLEAPPSGEHSPVVRFLYALIGFDKPMVAAVEGPAVGIGCTMLLHCDLVYASEDARFQLPFVNLGLCPEAASSYLLPRVAGLQRASELLLLGEPFDALRARDAGIVNEVLPHEVVRDRALERARALAARPPAAVRGTRDLIRAGLRDRLEDVLGTEIELFARRLVSPEAKEAFSAFVEKRPPDFSNLG
jgi:enoyl-CoA hydratase/carnithine racemase